MSAESKIFENKKKSLIQEFDTSDDFAGLNLKVKQLQHELNQNVSGIPPYDVERYSNELAALSVKIKDKLQKDGQAGTRKFAFKKKLTFTKQKESLPVEMNTLQKNTEYTDSEKLLLDSNCATYTNLNNCIVYSKNKSDEQTDHLKESGSLTFQNLKKCTVDIPFVNFTGGSIFIDSCQHTSFLFCIPWNNAIQIRIRSLKYCQLKFQPACNKDAIQKQNIIFENIQDCVFDEQYQDSIILQNFDNLGAEKACTKGYTFAFI